MEKAERIEKLINHLYNNVPEFGNKYLLKGGTAINLLYDNKPRLSLDGDFNYNIPCSKDVMVQDRDLMDKQLIQVLTACGYQVKKDRSSWGQDVYELFYKTVKNSSEKIKIELNYMLRVQTKASFMLPNTHIHIVGLHELFGAKLAALATRAKIRDLFDIYYLVSSKFIQQLK